MTTLAAFPKPAAPSVLDEPDVPAGVELRDVGDAAAIRKWTYNRTLDAVKTLPPISNQRYTLRIANPRYEDRETYTPQEQKKAILTRGTLGRRLLGDWELMDNASGKVIDKRQSVLALVPAFTERGTFVDHGNDYTLEHQMRLRAGTFARIKDNGELETHVNVLPGKGLSHRIFLDPESGVFRMSIGQAKLPLLPVLRALGVKDSQIREAWGRDLAAQNMEKGDTTALDKIYNKLLPHRLHTGDLETRREAVAKLLTNYQLDPEVTKRTLRQPFSNVSGDQMLAVTKKLLAISRGEDEPDDRDHLAYMQVHGPEDLIAERITNAKRSLQALLWKVTNRSSLDPVPSGFFNKAIRAAILSSGLGMPIESINPAQIFEQQGRLTRMGVGGIPSQDSIPDSARDVQPSHFGFLDPVITPESGTIGVDVRIATNTKKGSDGRLYTKLTDKRGREVWRSAQDLADATIAFPQTMHTSSPMVPALAKGKLQFVPRSKVDFMLPEMTDAFAPVTNLVPMKSAMHPQRTAMASRMITQALPLVSPEAPLVQAAVPNSDRSFDEELGERMGAIRSKVEGHVLSASDGKIVIKDAEGKTHEQEYYENFPYNMKSVTGRTTVTVRRTDNSIWLGHARNYKPLPGDSVLSIDPVTHRSAWLPSGGFIKHRNDKKLVRVVTDSGRTVDMTVDHGLVTVGDNGELVPIFAADCVIGFTRLPVALLPHIESESPPIAGDDYDLGCLAGLYAAEGHPPKNGNKNTISLAVTPDERAAEILELCSRLGLNAYRCSGSSVNFTEKDVRKWLVSIIGSGSGRKFISPVVYNYSRRFLEGLIAGYMGGDGCLAVDGNGAIQVYGVSTSATLRYGLSDVLSLLGIFTTFETRPVNSYNPAWNDAYGFRVLSGHLAKLSRWFFYSDRQLRFSELCKDSFRSSTYEHVPVPTTAARRTLYAEYPGTVPAYIYKTAHLGAVAKHRLQSCSGAFGAWGSSDVMWDTVAEVYQLPHEEWVYDFCVPGAEVFAADNGLIVHNTALHTTPLVKAGQFIKAGDLLARSNYTTENGITALGRNARVAYIPFRGGTYEDAYQISESFAKNLTSEHSYQHVKELPASTGKSGLHSFRSIFPGTFKREQLEKMGEDGVVKVGQTVNYGDPLILFAKEKSPSRTRVHKARQRSFVDDSEIWEHDSPGVVTDVERKKDGVVVVVKSTQAMKVGDKMADRYGTKGVVSSIIPDDQMPKNAAGEPFEVLVNPLTMISRRNPSQVLEAWLGKVAAATGQPVKVPDFGKVENLTQFAKEQLEKAGLSDTETIQDAENSRPIRNVLTGNKFYMKLHHTAESKIQGRSTGGYTADEAPAKGGGGSGSKRVGLLATYALLSHGAGDVLSDIANIRGQKQPQYWQQYMAGFRPPTPPVSRMFQKFVNYMRGAGINVTRDGTRFNVMAMTDKDVDELASDREVKRADTLDWKSNDLRPIAGGLFDEKLTGGLQGTNWSFIKLPEPMPNPVMEDPIRHILGLTQKQFRDVLSGRDEINGQRGPKALASALEKINLDREIDQARMDVESGRKGARNAAARRLGYLKDAKRLGIHPKEWILSRVPVLPPIFRPVSTLQLSGGKETPLVADANYLYKELLDAKDVFAASQGKFADMSDEREAVYNAFKAVTGLGDPSHPKNQERQVKGLLKHVFGSSPKHSMVQARLTGRTVDLVGRAVITPDADLDMDGVGIPEKKAWEIYKPFIIRRLVRSGMPSYVAAEEADKQSTRARQAMLEEMDDRPVMIDRAPTLHRYGIMAFWPKLVKDDTMHINPLVTAGFGADFDGDQMNFQVSGEDDAAREMAEKMLPSRNLLSVAKFRAHQLPSKEFLAGLYSASRPQQGRPPVVFATIKDAIAAYRNGRYDADQEVSIAQQR